MAKWWTIIIAALLIIALVWAAFSFKNSKYDETKHTEVTLENSADPQVGNTQNSTTLLNANDPSSASTENQTGLEPADTTNNAVVEPSSSQPEVPAESP